MSCRHFLLFSLTLFQGHSLLISDPKALHHILVKDQDVFEEWSAFTACVKSVPIAFQVLR